MTEPELAGVLIIDKAKGPTSHDIVASLRRILHMRKIGHCGTLDPLATGVLVVSLGRYTRLNRWLSGADKSYEAKIELGATSPTGDAQGQITPLEGADPPDLATVERALERFVGVQQQQPPVYSAIKIDGVPSYKRARRGEEVKLRPRQITIHGIERIQYDYPELTLRVNCSSGTYIRSLAMDLGSALGTGAYLADLRRISVGRLDLATALTLEEVATCQEEGRIREVFAHPRLALDDLESVDLEEEELRDFTFGKAVPTQPSGGEVADVCAVFGAGDTLFGIARRERGALHPFCVLRQHQAG